MDFNAQFTAFRVECNARFAALETLASRLVLVEEATSSQRPISVAPIVAPIITTSTSITPSITQTQTNAFVSSASIRMLERDMPTLSEENFPDRLDHAIAYAHAAGWGESDVPEVYTDKIHLSSKIAREFLYNKLSVRYRQRVTLEAIVTAAELWDWLNKVATVSAERTLMTTLTSLLNLKVTSDDSIIEFSVHAIRLREKLVLGGGTMDDKTLLGIILHGLPADMAKVRNDVNDQLMDLHTALAYLQRAEDYANTYETKHHSALVAHQRSTTNDKSDRISSPRHANRPSSYVPPAHAAKHTCDRCGLKGHLPIVCEAALPLTSAYERYQSF